MTGCRKLHNEKLQNLYSSPYIFRMIRSRRIGWANHVACVGEMRNAYRILVGKPQRKRPLRKPRRRWENNIKMNLKEIGFGGMDWIHLPQDMDR
jgi:hypothetical protein